MFLNNTIGISTSLQKLEKLIRQAKWSKASQLLHSKKFSEANMERRAKKAQKLMSSMSISDETSSCTPTESTSSSTEDITGSSMSFLLNLAILNDAPGTFVQVFLDVFPGITARRDRKGMTALHIACASRATNPDLIGALIRHDLGGMAIAQDSEGKTPMHHLLFYVCYPKRKESLQWGKYGYCHGESYSIVDESNNSVRAEYEGSSLSISQEEFNAIVTCINLLCKYGINSLFVRANDDLTPIDVLHECKASLAEGVKKGPKWERADIINIVVRQRLIKFYRQQRRIAESNSFFKPEEDALPGSDLPDLQSSSVVDSDAFSSAAGTFTGLSKLEATCISIGDSIMSS